MDTILIGIAGGTGSGKTTLEDKLVESFGRDEVSILRHDNYYKRHDDIPFEERAKLNYDHPDAFDTDLLCQHILELKAGSFYAHIRAYGLSHQGNISRFCTAGRKSGGGFYEVSAGFFCELARFYFLFIG